MPRALKVLDHGVLIGEPPNLWLMKDTDGDLKADTKESVVNTYGNAERRHRAQREQPVLGDGQRHVLVRAHLGPAAAKNGKFESLPALAAASGRCRRTTRAASIAT